MSESTNPSMRRSVALGALLLLVTTATGCGVGLPTQPTLDSAARSERIAVNARAQEPRTPEEMNDPSPPAGGSEEQDVVNLSESCVKQCNDRYVLLFDEEQNRHRANMDQCQTLPEPDKAACMATEESRHSEEKERLDREKSACQEACRPTQRGGNSR